MQNTSPKLDFRMYNNWISQGRSYSDIREDLAAKGYTDAEISRLIRTIDNEQHSKLHRKENNSIAMILMAVGVLLFLMGAGVTVFTYMQGQSAYIIFYGAIFAGIGIFLAGWAKKD